MVPSLSTNCQPTTPQHPDRFVHSIQHMISVSSSHATFLQSGSSDLDWQLSAQLDRLLVEYVLRSKEECCSNDTLNNLGSDSWYH